jgi:hypothetical protein
MFHIEFQKFVREGNLNANQKYAMPMCLDCTGNASNKNPCILKEKYAPRHKSSIERLTVMCCGNASGNHKLKLVVIEKAKKP